MKEILFSSNTSSYIWAVLFAPEGVSHLPSLSSVSMFGNEGGDSRKNTIVEQVKVQLFLLSGS